MSILSTCLDKIKALSKENRAYLEKQAADFEDDDMKPHEAAKTAAQFAINETQETYENLLAATKKSAPAAVKSLEAYWGGENMILLSLPKRHIAIAKKMAEAGLRTEEEVKAALGKDSQSWAAPMAKWIGENASTRDNLSQVEPSAEDSSVVGDSPSQAKPAKAPKKRRRIDSPARREAYRLLNGKDTQLTAINKIVGGIGKIQIPNQGFLKALKTIAGRRNLTEAQLEFQKKWDGFDSYQGKSSFGTSFNGKVAQELWGMMFTLEKSNSAIDDWAALLGGVTNDEAMLEVMGELDQVARGISRENDTSNDNREWTDAEIADELAKREAKEAASEMPQEDRIKELQDEGFDRANQDGPLRNDEPISADEMVVGQKITIDGEEMTVNVVEFKFNEVGDKEVDYVILQDGKRFGRQVLEGGEVVYEERDEEAPTKKAAPVSKMDIRNADSKELFGDDGGFKLGQQDTTDGDKVNAARKENEEAKAAQDAAQRDIFSQPSPAQASEEVKDVRYPTPTYGAASNAAKTNEDRSIFDQWTEGEQPNGWVNKQKKDGNWISKKTGVLFEIETTETLVGRMGSKGLRWENHVFNPSGSMNEKLSGKTLDEAQKGAENLENYIRRKEGKPELPSPFKPAPPSFNLETQTDEQIKAEQAAAKIKAEIQKRQDKKHTESAGDLTADMFGGGDTPLFNEQRDTPAVKAPTKPTKQKGPSRLDLLENYFTPGKIVKSYGGEDRVISFNRGEGEQWSVTVQAVDDTDNRGPRSHSTMPGNKDLVKAWQPPTKPDSLKAAPAEVGQNQLLDTASPEFKALPVEDKRVLKAKQDAAKAARIEDFGEVILGAKKDLWGRFTHALEQDLPADVADMAISKSFPEPDYESAIAQGIPVDSLATYKAIRDAIPSKPRKGYKLERWATMFRGVHPLMQKLATGAELSGTEIQAISTLFRGENLVDKVNFYKDLGFPAFSKASDWKVIDRVHIYFEKGAKLETPILKTVAVFKKRFTSIDSAKTDREGFMEVLDKVRAKIIAEMETPAEKKSKSTTFSIYSDRLTKDVFIGKKAVNGVIRMKTGFPDAKSARQYLQDNQAQLDEQWKGMGAKPDYRRQVNAPRQGPTRRDGDATPDQFQEAFGFRGVQFGNWVEDNRRQVDINEAFDAFMDLAEAIGIPPRAVSLDGSLGLAFGARGHAGAAAHYEPGQVVINLTKKAGPGSLAHEWFHAFDNYFARLDKTGETKAKPIDAFATTGSGSPKNMRPAVWNAFKNINAVLAKGPFAERSKKLDDVKSKPYYQTTIEKAARAFERYTVDRLEGEEISNDYLVNIVKDFDPALPTVEEMNSGIREAFDKLFGVLEVEITDQGTSLRSAPLPAASKITAAQDADGVYREYFQERVIAAQDFVEGMRGVKVNPDGSLTLYHGTSKASQSAILQSGEIHQGGFFSIKQSGTEYGDSPMDVAKRKHGKDGVVMGIKVDARSIESAAAGSEIYAPEKLIRGDDGVWTSMPFSPASDSILRSAPLPAAKAIVWKDALDEDRKRLRIPPAWTDVKVNADPNGMKQAVGKDAKGRGQSVYSPAHHAASHASKFERAKRVNAAMPAIGKRVGEDSLGGKNQEEAAVVRLIYLTGFRNGGDGDTGAEVQAYGASTLRAEHVEVNGDDVTFDFTGKKGVAQKHVVKDAQLAKDITTRKAGGGELFKTNSTKVLAYLRKISEGDFKVHDLRTWNATELANRLIAVEEMPADETAYWLKRDAIGDIVARKLGDTRKIVLDVYIDPIVFAKWAESVNISHVDPRPKIGKREAKASGTAGELSRPFGEYERALRDEFLPPGSPTSSSTAARRGGGSSGLAQSSLLSASLPSDNLEPLKQRARDAFAKAEPKIKEAEAMIEAFGPGSLGVNPRFANFGGSDQLARNEVDIVRAFEQSNHEVRKDRDTFARAKELLAKDEAGVYKLALEGAFGAGDAHMGISDHQQLAIEMLSQKLVREANGDIKKVRDAQALIWANILNRKEAGRVLRIGFDKFMTPLERANQQLANLIFALHPKIEKRAKTMTYAERKAFFQQAGENRVKQVDEALMKAHGIRLAEVLKQRNEATSKVTKLEKEILKLKTVREQRVIQKIKEGVTPADIKRLFNLSAEESAAILKSYREAMADKLRKMLQSGMTEAQIREAEKDSLQTSSLNPGNAMTPAEIEAAVARMMDHMPSEADYVKRKPITRTPKAKVKLTEEEKAHPLSTEWSRTKFSDGLKDANLDAKDRAGIMSRVEAIRLIADGVGQIAANKEQWADYDKELERIKMLTGEAKEKAMKDLKRPGLTGAQLKDAESKMAEINTILAKYGSSAAEILTADKGIESYGFDPMDMVQMSTIARTINQIDADWVDKSVEFLYANMLWGPQTALVNMTAAVNAAWQMIGGRFFDASINLWLKDPMAAQFGEAKYVMRALAPALKRAGSNFVASWLAQHPMVERDLLGSEVDWEAHAGGFRNKIQGGVIGGQVGKYNLGNIHRTPLRVLTATDDFNKTLFGMAEAAAFAYRLAVKKGKTKGDPDFGMKPGDAKFERFIRIEMNTAGSFSMKMGVDKASRMIFSNALPGQKNHYTGEIEPVNDIGGVIGKGAAKLNDFVSGDHDNIAAKIMLALLRISFFPFQRTPFNIVRQGMRYAPNPISLVDIGMGIFSNNRQLNAETGKMEFKRNAQGRNNELLERASQQLQGAILLSALVALGVAEGDDDDQDKWLVMTGTAPWSPAKRAEKDARERAGVGAYRVSWRREDGSERAGFSYARIEPIATSLSTVIDTIRTWKRIMKNGGDASDIMSNLMGGLVAQTKDKTFLRGFGDLFDLITNTMAADDIKEPNQRKMNQFLVGKIAMVMPNIIKQPLREADSSFRERSDSFGKELVYQLFPYGQKAEKVSPIGGKLEKPKATGSETADAAIRTLDVTDSGTTKVDPVDQMLLRWRDSRKWESAAQESNRKPWFPSPILSAEFKNAKTGLNVKMTGPQLTEFRQKAGQRASALLKSANLNTKNPSERDILKVKELISKARSDMKNALRHKFSQ